MKGSARDLLIGVESKRTMRSNGLSIFSSNESSSSLLECSVNRFPLGQFVTRICEGLCDTVPVGVREVRLVLLTILRRVLRELMLLNADVLNDLL